MTDAEIKSRLEGVVKRMSDACLTHKTEMRKLEYEIRRIQTSCKHGGEWAERCPSCGKTREVKG